MNATDRLTHFDRYRHTRMEEVRPGEWRCLECLEMGVDEGYWITEDRRWQ